MGARPARANAEQSTVATLAIDATPTPVALPLIAPTTFNVASVLVVATLPSATLGIANPMSPWDAICGRTC